jgi:hypothetical protein
MYRIGITLNVAAATLATASRRMTLIALTALAVLISLVAASTASAAAPVREVGRDRRHVHVERLRLPRRGARGRQARLSLVVRRDGRPDSAARRRPRRPRDMAQPAHRGIGHDSQPVRRSQDGSPRRQRDNRLHRSRLRRPRQRESVRRVGKGSDRLLGEQHRAARQFGPERRSLRRTHCGHRLKPQLDQEGVVEMERRPVMTARGGQMARLLVLIAVGLGLTSLTGVAVT